jgi:arginase
MKMGVEAAPMALIESGLLTQLSEDLDYDVHHDNIVHYYEKDIPAEDPDHRGMKKPRAVSAVTERLSSQVYNYAKDGKFVLTLGGDHSIAIGSVSGTAKAIRERLGREMAVIWVDAHADINLPELSPSGNIHGMPMAFLTRLAREDKRDIFGWLQDEHIVSTRKLVYIGLRDVDRGEKKILRENGIKAFSMHDVDRYVFPSSFYLFLADWFVVTVLAASSRRLWPTLAMILPSTCRSMSMRWIRSGRRALVPRCVEV